LLAAEAVIALEQQPVAGATQSGLYAQGAAKYVTDWWLVCARDARFMGPICVFRLFGMYLMCKAVTDFEACHCLPLDLSALWQLAAVVTAS
jgi:hypothetical protein